MAVDQNAAWVTFESMRSSGNEGIVRVPLDGGQARVVFSGNWPVTRLTFDDDALIWVDRDGIHRMPR